MSLRIEIDPDVFNLVYLTHGIGNQNYVQIYFGGSSGGKSEFLSDRCILDVLSGRNYLITRKVAATIEKTVFNQVVKSIHKFKLGAYFDVIKNQITCKLNGHQIFFAGMDDPEKIKSIVPKVGVITDIWMEEATEFDRADYKQFTKRLRGISPFKKRLHLSFNPILQTHWIYVDFFGIWRDDKQYVEQDGVSILKTTHKDNMFLTQQDHDALENEKDKYYFEVYTLGNWGIIGKIIFKTWKVEEFNSEQFANYSNGLDWGFDPDPFAAVRLSVDKTHKRIYVCDEVYVNGVTNDIASDLTKKMIGRERIICDSSEPKSIAEFVKLGVHAESAEKGPGSVESGIKFIQRFELIIHPRCVNFRNEIMQYRNKEDRAGNVLPEPIDKNNHLMDAMRYACESLMKAHWSDWVNYELEKLKATT
jgi:phage terminase large subunit